MSFPTTPLDVTVELNLDGVWTDITQYVYTRSPIQITRGRRGESSAQPEPSVCSLTINNRDGRFSPRNPSGPYYGTLGRNTPLRVSDRAGSVRLLVPVITTDYVSAPDSAGLSVTGDIDLRADVRLTSLSSSPRLIRKFATAGQGSYSLGILPTGLLRLTTSADGTTLNVADSTVPLPVTSGRIAVRATLDVDNGAAGKTTTFYYSDTISGTWTQLGSAVTTAGTTSIFDGTSIVQAGLDTVGEFYAAEIRNGIGGSLVGNPVFTAQTSGATSFADAQGNTWTTHGTATLEIARSYRVYAEVPAWPQKWDVSQTDAWTSIAASGVLRRLGQGAAALKSAFQRYVLGANSTATICGYWPMEDGAGATILGSGLRSPGAAYLSLTGTPQLASNSEFATNPIVVLAQTRAVGALDNPSATGTLYVQFLLSVPATGDTSGVLLRLYTTGTAPRWDINYVAGGGGGFTINAYDSSGTSLLSTVAGFQVDGVPAGVVFKIVQNGSNIDWSFGPSSYVAGAGTFGAAVTGTLAARTVGQGQYIELNSDQLLASTAIGHLVVFSSLPDDAAQLQALRGWIGETAGSRVSRLCAEEGIAFSSVGTLSDSAAMGSQRPLKFLELLSECEASDMGQLSESRTQLGLVYRTRSSKYAQTAALALPYGALSDLDPVEDDQHTRNDVTVTRINGSSARQTIDTGPLSTLAPPDGVGRYDGQVSVSLSTDAQCAPQAAWRANEGTIDEPRYPTIRTELSNATFQADKTLIDGALVVEFGDLLTVTNPPVWLPPEQIRQHVIGYTETLGVFSYGIDFVCQPASPAGDVGRYDLVPARWASGGVSTVSGSHNSSTTSLSVATPSGPLWTRAAADFPFDIVVAGEQMTVASISGATSPQTFTVTRSVNGVVKSHSSGESVEIYRPTRWAL